MQIGGVQWTSIIDYPDRLATTIFTVGCNLRCPFCQNRSLVIPEEYPPREAYPTEHILAKLKERKKYISAVVITGGEPTIQKDLSTFCQRLKEDGFSIKLDTNGLEPRILQKLIQKRLVDYIAMDYKAALSRYSDVTGRKVDVNKVTDSINLLTASGIEIPVEFRTTLAAPLVTLKDVKDIITDLSSRAVLRYYLQQVQQPDHPLVDPNFKIQAYPTRILKEFEEKELRPLFQETGVRGLL
ncbi:MAG: anaerobic ribonucleoside-triphosphate reductase activating protein [Candidatus Ranarchaeia archaeon]